MFPFLFDLSEFIGSTCVESFCSCKLRKPEVAPQPIEFRDSAISVVCCSCIKHYQTPKPDIGWAPYLFRNFVIRRLMSCNVLHRELVNPETRNCRAHTLIAFSHFDFLFHLCLCTMCSEILKLRVPPFLFPLFAISEVLVCKGWRLKSRDSEPRNPEGGSHLSSFFFSRFRSSGV
jgi:hypothetical protein